MRQRLTPRAGFPQVAGVVLDGPTLVAEAGIPDARSGLRLEVRIFDDDGWLGGDASGSAVRPESLVLAVETGRWMLLGAPAEGWDAATLGWRSTFRAVLVGGVLLIVFFTFAVFSRLDRLRAVVATSGSVLELALRAGRMGVWAYDIRKGDVRWSDVATSIIGVETEPDADRLQHVFTLMSAEDRVRVRAAFEATRDGMREGFVEEFRLDRPDGTVRWVLALAHLERGAAGRPENISGILSDVTERHALEEQVRQAQRLESEGMLAGGVAHDFNNLLTAIGGFAELAQSRAAEVGGPAGDEIVEDLRQVLVSVRRGTNLTSQLLAFSRRSPSAPSQVDVSRALEELQPILARLFAGRVDIVPDLATGLPPVRVEIGQLTQVMLNLLVVARDAMPHGGTVVMRTHDVRATGRRPAAAPPGEWVCIEVRYSAESAQAAGRSARPPVPGPAPETDESGLSVAVVQRAVETSGGRFAIETPPTGGAVFRVFLPLWRERV
jgi:PAS domain S-box-containing protein